MLRKKWQLSLLQVVLPLIALIFVFPIVMVYYNGFKSYAEILTDALALPQKWTLENFIVAWKTMNYPRLFCNTLFVTGFGVAGIVLFSAPAAYQLQRNHAHYSKGLRLLFLLPMLIPIQTIMITLTNVLTHLKLIDSLPGLVLAYWGLGIPMASFLFMGGVAAVPHEVEESAMMDGCNMFRLFWMVVFPLLKPVTGTVIILDVMWLWNDFLLPLLTVNGTRDGKTLQLGAYSFFGQYVTQWNFAIAGIVMAVTPTILFFILMQKHIVKGIIAGAVKG